MIEDNRKIPKIDKFGYIPKMDGYVKSESGTNYFLDGTLIEQHLCETVEQSVKSIDRLINNYEKFL
jgi:hypothetical protein